MLNRRVVLAMMAVSLFCACPGDGGEPGTPDSGTPDSGIPGGLTAETFLNQLAAAQKDLLDQCLGGMTSVYEEVLDHTFAESRGTLSAAVAAGRVDFDEAKARECLQAYATLTCSELISGSGSGSKLQACRDAFIPQVAPGGACYASQECIGGTCALASCPGQCVAFAAENESCGERQCAPELYCSSTMVCLARKPAGLGCSYDSECQDGLECGGDRLCAAPQEPGQAGETCGRCAEGLYCRKPDVFSDGVCAATLAAGAECGENYFDALGACGLGRACKGYVGDSSGTTVTKGTCAAPEDLGGSCASDIPGYYVVSGCGFGLYCLGGSCQAPPESGPCAESGIYRCDPLSAWCDSTNQCVAKMADNDVCSAPGECQSDSCQSGLCQPECDPS